MKNKKGFSLVELIVSVAIVAALSVYFFKIILVLNAKYHEIEKVKNNIINETYITRLLYDGIDKEYTITLYNGDYLACPNCIKFSYLGVDKIIKITGMDITQSSETSEIPVTGPYTVPITFDDEEYNIILYY